MKKEIKKAVDWIMYKQIPAWVLVVLVIIWVIL
jgi:hypothetical protein